MPQLGAAQTVIVCLNGSSGIQGACPSGQIQSVIQAYLIAPSEATRFELGSEPFDAVQAGAFFGFAFTSTIFLWLFSLGLGYVLKMVKTA